VSAVFCANDQLALGVLRALHEAERDVPGEISVVGFDDNPESAEYWPPLTTVRQNFAEVGQRAFALLNEAIQQQDVSPGLRLIDNQLVVRASTGAFRAQR
jgi:DNA-binding LacI/PurR family transcriptional regulator